jgi:hypothetical protein
LFGSPTQCSFWIEPIQRNQFLYWAYFGFSYAVFLALYSWMVLAPRLWMRRAGLIGLAILGCSYTPFNYGFIGLPIYIAARLPFLVRKTRNVVLLLVAVCAGMAAQGHFLQIDAWGWGVSAFLHWFGVEPTLSMGSSSGLRTSFDWQMRR